MSQEGVPQWTKLRHYQLNSFNSNNKMSILIKNKVMTPWMKSKTDPLHCLLIENHKTAIIMFFIAKVSYQDPLFDRVYLIQLSLYYKNSLRGRAENHQRPQNKNQFHEFRVCGW